MRGSLQSPTPLFFFLVRSGIDSISVNNDAVITATKLVASIEKRMILERLAEQSKAINQGNSSKFRPDDLIL